MAGPKPGPRTVRPPAVAGTFYPAEAVACHAQARSFVEGATIDPAVAQKRWVGGIVPHAGWICSGAIAGQTIAALAASSPRHPVDLVVVFGAVHSAAPLDVAALDAHDRWDVPGGSSDLPGDVERRLIETSASLFRIDERFHRREHAVEVELPLIQAAWPHATVLPIEVPAVDEAVRMGIATAREVHRAGLNAIYLASSDLTHYGPAYRFAPAGVGAGALEWAKGNDRRLLQWVMDMQVEKVVPEVRNRLNACGGGAIAAMMAAGREHGACSGSLLRHANSYETLAGVVDYGPENAVGYAALVVG